MKIIKYFLVLISISQPQLAFASNWSCKKLIDTDIGQTTAEIKEYKKISLPSELHSTSEVFKLNDDTIIQFNHLGCKTMADGKEKKYFEIKILLKDGSTIPTSPTDNKWFDLAIEKLNHAGLCEKIHSVDLEWCEVIKQTASQSKIKKISSTIHQWQKDSKLNKFGEIETYVFQFPTNHGHDLILRNIITTEGDSAD